MTRKLVKSLLLTGLVALLLGGPVLGAASPEQGIVGNDGEILSELSVYAGTGGFAYREGDASSAQFRMAKGVLALEDGSVLVSDSRNHVIRLIEDGQVSTYAGFDALPTDANLLPVGSLIDSDASRAVFNEPAGLDTDGQGNIYIADQGNHAVRVITTDGQVETVAGDGVRGLRDGNGSDARFFSPSDVVVAEDGTLYVSDTNNHLIRKIDPEGNVTTLNAESDRTIEVVDGVVLDAGSYRDGPIEDALFNEPTGLALDASGNLYISDSGNHLIRYIDFVSNSVITVSGTLPEEGIYEQNELYATPGFTDGSAVEAQFNYPKGLALTADGGLMIADTNNHTVRYLSSEGEVITLAGSTEGTFGSVSGINGHNLLDHPWDVTVDSEGRVFIADAYNNVIRAYDLYQLPDELPMEGEIHVVFGHQVIEFDANPEIVNDRTFVPLRAVVEAFEYDVEYANGDQMIELSKEDVRVRMVIGETTMTVQSDALVQAERTLDAAPYLKDERTYVPIRFFSEEFGMDVQWHAPTRTVIIREQQ